MTIQLQKHVSKSKNEQVKELPVTFLDLLEAIWQGKWVITICAIAFLLLAVVYAVLQPNIYKSTSLLTPSQSNSGSALGNMSSQLGGLAALAGVELGGSEQDQASLAVQILKSREFVSYFIKKYDLLVPIMAAEGWSLETNELLYDSEIYNVNEDKWLREPSGLVGAKPSLQEAYEVFMEKYFYISLDKENGSYTISVEHYSPYIAKEWVELLNYEINEVMRERAKQESKENLNYLNSQLDKTRVVEMRNTFYELIKEQTRSLMLAEVQKDYVFKVIDPPVVPEKKVKPSRALLAIAGLILGLTIGLMIVFISFVIKNDKKYYS
ncbi:Wzz/FepE/Etk N-terminal domain-containing protein [Pseudoalteromonas sp. ACER1]|uniref:Wzz/FepE/Etk N-terminal domain-containing protein n=2 Tax=Pseudoalteromonas TaxID=53246 RepID=UPI001F209AD6|nr:MULTISPECIES: Wzz/FepE/Etk N-terminal domain-containing protein [unclassified Pseudoalteromonas]MCF2917986.1 Wzz/FepE/Etk N-terminal domain-containing protein [Pseudoalteromonas sp. Cn5-37]MCO7209668.1 Wzz/FepE/Etk N-terminal domain-containing protein [Pseudoalteromonas sp. ACER1]